MNKRMNGKDPSQHFFCTLIGASCTADLPAELPAMKTRAVSKSYGSVGLEVEMVREIYLHGVSGLAMEVYHWTQRGNPVQASASQFL